MSVNRLQKMGVAPRRGALLKMALNNDPQITVIIATKNRADALDKICFPSLLTQTIRNFEVIIWDASTDRATESVCSDYRHRFEEIGVPCRYYQAPRSGLAAQRNDAVKSAKGEIVAFFDDDSELSCDALAALYEDFAKKSSLKGVEILVVHGKNETSSKLFSFFKEMLLYFFLMRYPDKSKQVVLRSGMNVAAHNSRGIYAEWLSGCSMAYRKEVFTEFRFNESLMKFGGYSLGEDADFSYRIFKKYPDSLYIADSGYVIHHAASGGERTKGKNDVAARLYLRWTLASYVSEVKKFVIPCCIWTCLGEILFMFAMNVLLRKEISFAVFIQGIKDAFRAVKE